MPKSDDFDWTDAAIATLKVLWASELSTLQIAEAMHTSKSSIVGKAHRLFLPPRPSPIIRNVDGTPAPKLRRPHRPKITLPPVFATEISVEIQAQEPAPPRSTRKSEPCCWPIGESRTPKFRYCDEPSVPGFPYCPQHHAKGVVSRRPALQVHGIGAIP